MTITLPADARQHIEDRDPMAAVAALAEAANRGEIDVSAVIAFAKASNSGTPITYQKTRPVSLRIKEFIEANPTEPPLKLVYLGVARKLWTEADCDQWQLNAAALSDARKTSVSRGVYLTRNRRTQGRIAQVSDQFVPKIALDIVCSHKLTDGAKLCLEVLMALAGKGNRVVTYTASIARMLGRTPRTVRNHFIQLEAAGLITRTAGRAANTVQIVIHDMVKPEPYKEPRDITAFKLARRSADPALRNLAETLTALSWEKHHGDVQGTETGRKKISAFNPESKQRESDEREICQDDDQRIAKAGVTTHSNFVMTYKTNRNDWNRRKPERYGQQPMVSSSLPSTR
jgi:DNA-binding Lrp family transcriptional regulator